MEKPDYRKLRTLADGLWVADDTWKRSPLDRRMTVMSLGNGRLAVHNGILLDDAEMTRLEARGEVAMILAPNLYHGSEAGDWARRYPDARVFVPKRAVRKLRKRCPRIDGTFEDDWPGELDHVLRCQPLSGMRLFESVFLHVPTRTLVLTDMCFNLPDRYKGFTRWFLRWNGVLDRFAVSKLARLWFFNDKAALAETMRPVLWEWDYERVIVNHGEILESGGKAKMREQFAFLYS